VTSSVETNEIVKIIITEVSSAVKDVGSSVETLSTNLVLLASKITESNLTHLNETVNTIDRRLDGIDNAVKHNLETVVNTVGVIDRRLDGFDASLENETSVVVDTETKVGSIEGKVNRLREDSDALKDVYNKFEKTLAHQSNIVVHKVPFWIGVGALTITILGTLCGAFTNYYILGNQLNKRQVSDNAILLENQRTNNEALAESQKVNNEMLMKNIKEIRDSSVQLEISINDIKGLQNKKDNKLFIEERQKEFNR